MAIQTSGYKNIAKIVQAIKIVAKEAGATMEMSSTGETMPRIINVSTSNKTFILTSQTFKLISFFKISKKALIYQGFLHYTGLLWINNWW